jgi:hypothetical protein
MDLHVVAPLTAALTKFYPSQASQVPRAMSTPPCLHFTPASSLNPMNNCGLMQLASFQTLSWCLLTLGAIM